MKVCNCMGLTCACEVQQTVSDVARSFDGWTSLTWACRCGASGKGLPKPAGHAMCDRAGSATTTSTSRGVSACLRCKGVHAAGYVCDYGTDAMVPQTREQSQGGLIGVGRSETTGLVAGAAGYAHARTFTREEVLTVLRVLKMHDYSNDPDAVFARIIATFERME